MDKVRILGARAGQVWPGILPEIGRQHAAGLRVLLLVPEQYTLQAERELVEGLNLPGLIDLDVLSPRRLTRLLRERGGHDELAPLDDRGRRMALAQALSITGDTLTYYRRVASAPGLPDKLSSLLADFQRCGMTPQALSLHAQSLPEGSGRAKMEDLARLWAAYEQIIEGRFADETMQQQALLRSVGPSGVFDGAALWVYGFDVLPGPMCRLLSEAAQRTHSLCVTMTMDSREAPDGRIFQTQRRSAQELIACLEEKGLPWELRYLPWRESGRVPVLEHLERYLFTRRSVPYEEDASAVSVHAAANPYAETLYAVQQLRKWHEEGIAWSRMAIALGAPGELEGMLAVTLDAGGIPYYMARKDSAQRHGLCRMLLGALRTVAGGYARQDVLDMAKSGFSPLTEEEASALENYAREHGISGGKWRKPFVRGENAEAMEALRLRLITPVEALHQRLLHAKTAEASVEAVFLLLEEVGSYQRLMRREEELLARGMAAQAAQNRQVWQLVMGLLEQLHALLGKRRATLKDMARFVASGLSSASISALPPRPDTVMIGEAGHLMTGRVDALLIMGMQDGALASGMESLLTEQERDALAQSVHSAVGLTRYEQMALRQSDFYRTFALPRKRLTVTFSQGGQDGAALRPAGLIQDMQALLPRMRVTGGVTASGMEARPLSPMLALDGLALRLRQMADGQRAELEPSWQAALDWLWQSPVWHGRIQQLFEHLEMRHASKRLPPELTRRLFGSQEVSISRLETFAACPYRHFVDYGLRPRQRKDYVFEADEKGSFFHEALRQYAALAATQPTWPNVEEADVERMMTTVLHPLTRAWEGGPLTDSGMGRQLGKSYLRTIRRAAWLFTCHARNSRFTTVGTEVAFGMEGGLPPVILSLRDGRRVALRGVIDRIDRWEGDAGVYLRVVDYKSSHHALDATRMYYGLQLQLLLYLQAATQYGPFNPAGAFYFTVDDPMVDSPEDILAEAQRQIARALRLKGVVLADAEVVGAMDADTPELSLGKIFNRDGSVERWAQAYTLEEMHALLEHTRQTAARLAEAIGEGEMSAAPAVIGDQWSACMWCGLDAVCGMDPSLPGAEKRVLPVLSREEFLQRLTNHSDDGESSCIFCE